MWHFQRRLQEITTWCLPHECACTGMVNVLRLVGRGKICIGLGMVVRSLNSSMSSNAKKKFGDKVSAHVSTVAFSPNLSWLSNIDLV